MLPVDRSLLLGARAKQRQLFLWYQNSAHKMMFAITCVLASLALASGAVEGDRITKLPGFVGDLPSTHYSGCEYT
jgi:hypothetical protein